VQVQRRSKKKKERSVVEGEAGEKRRRAAKGI